MTPEEPLPLLAIGHPSALADNHRLIRRLVSGPNLTAVAAPGAFPNDAGRLSLYRTLRSFVIASPSACSANPADARKSSDWLLPHDGVTLLRAAVCLSILVLHLQPATVANWPDALAFLPAPTWFVQHTRLGFESFFVLAGYFLAHSFRPGPWKTFSVAGYYCKRLVRLLLPYWTIVFVSWLGLAVGSLRRHQPIDYPITALWRQLLCLHDLAANRLVSGQLWFMAPLIQFYVLWGLCFWTVRRMYLRNHHLDYHPRSIRAMSLLTMIAFVVSIFMADFFGAGFTLPVNAHYLALGCLIYWYSHSQISWWMVIFAMSQEIALGCTEGASRPIAAAIGGLLLIYGAGRAFSAGPRLGWLMSIGRCSYSIYLTHMFIGPRVMTLLAGRQEFYGDGVALWLAGIISSVLGGYIFYRVVELPSARWAQGISYRQ